MTESWGPTATLESLRLRARILARIRAFFADRGVLEVETPVLSRGAVTDAAIESFATSYSGPGPGRLYLHTSPEFPMKRLLAAGSGDIYQLCRVFRDGEAGRRHNPEFTLLEWYRVGYDHHRLMDEVEELLRHLFAGVRPLERCERLTYREAFLRHAGIDPLAAGGAALRRRAEALGVPLPAGLGDGELDGWRDLLLSLVVEPRLGREGVTFLYDYPASQAALARIEGEVAQRFELYAGGVELGNGFYELTDAREQRRRFEADLERRRGQGLDEPPMDEHFLAALAEGMPACAGVAIGVDRLLMALSGAASLAEVIAFPIGRA